MRSRPSLILRTFLLLSNTSHSNWISTLILNQNKLIYLQNTEMSREVVELTLTRYNIALLLRLWQIIVWTVFDNVDSFPREPGTKQSWGLRLVGGLDVGTVLKVEKVRYFCLHILIFHLLLYSPSLVSELTMKQTGMEMRRYLINDQSPTARVRDPEYHVVTRDWWQTFF